jgi:hypothetical protein
MEVRSAKLYIEIHKSCAYPIGGVVDSANIVRACIRERRENG